MADPGTHEAIARDIEAVARIEAVPTILQVIAAQTGLGLTLVARVTPSSWTACAVLDRIGFGLAPGGTLDVATTLCDQVRATRTPIVIEHASQEPAFCEHPTPKMYGFESYVSIPIHRASGEYFGTLCGLDREPRKLRDGKTQQTLELFAQLISLQLQAEDTLQQTEAALGAEKDLAALREQFMAVLGHDLRNPLQSIVVGAAVLTKHELPPAPLAIVERIQRSAQRIERLTADMLDLTRARLGSGLPVEVTEVADLDLRIRHVIDELASAHATRSIRADIEDVGIVRCDCSRVEQATSNLVANAVAHGDPARPIEVELRGGADTVTLSVRNGGAVIPPAVLVRIFEPFYRSADSAAGGLGLGLFIVAEIARAHGGRATATSTADQGTTFSITLPRAPR